MSHGCEKNATTTCGWIRGDAIALLRDRSALTAESINNASSWEVWSNATRRWTSLSHAYSWTDARWAENAAPIVRWPGRVGVTNVVRSSGRFLMFVSVPTAHGWSNGTMDSWVAEADELTGPWRLVSYWTAFGPQGYFLNAPPPWMRGDSMWTYWSAAWNLQTVGDSAQPAFCEFGPGRPPSTRGNCYGSVLGEMVLT